MGPWIPIAVGFAGSLVIEKYKEYKAKQPNQPLLGSSHAVLSPFNPSQIAAFTQPTSDGRALRFDPPKVFRMQAAFNMRSVQPVSVRVGPLQQVMQGHQLVPYNPALLSARALLDQSFALGYTIVASLETIYVAVHPPVHDPRMVLLVGGSGLFSLAAAGSGYAVIECPVIVQARQESPTPVDSPPAPAPNEEIPPVVPDEESTEDPTEPAPPPTASKTIGAAPVSKSNGVVASKTAPAKVPKTQTPEV